MKRATWRRGQHAICACRGDRFSCVVAHDSRTPYPILRDEQGELHRCTSALFIDRRRKDEEREKIEIDLTHAHAAIAHAHEREEWLKMLDASSAQIADKYGKLMMAYTQLELLCKNAISRIGMASTRDSLNKALRAIER